MCLPPFLFLAALFWHAMILAALRQCDLVLLVKEDGEFPHPSSLGELDNTDNEGPSGAGGNHITLLQGSRR